MCHCLMWFLVTKPQCDVDSCCPESRWAAAFFNSRSKVFILSVHPLMLQLATFHLPTFFRLVIAAVVVVSHTLALFLYVLWKVSYLALFIWLPPLVKRQNVLSSFLKHPCLDGPTKTTNNPQHSVWKSPKMSHLNFWILAFSTNFCPIKTDLSGNTVWPQA